MKTPSQPNEIALQKQMKRIRRELPIEDAKEKVKAVSLVPKKKQGEDYRAWKRRYDRQYYKDNRVRMLKLQAINRAKHPKPKRFCVGCGVEVGSYRQLCDKCRDHHSFLS